VFVKWFVTGKVFMARSC